MRQLFVSTDKTFLTDLPRYAYKGRIVTILSEGEAARAVRALKRSPLLGIDTETRPSFRKGRMNQVALLQVAADDICFLFRLNFFGFSPALVELLSDTSITKVGLSLKDDFHMLGKRHQFVPGSCIELQDYVKQMGIADMSLQKLYANVFHQRISKGARLTNWEADVLTDAQKTYAATDAVACLNLYRELQRLRESGEYVLVGGEV